MTGRPRGRRAAPWILGLVVVMVAATTAGALWSRTPDSDASRFAAPLPSPVVVAQGVSSANAEHVFYDPARDFAMMRPVFNAVSLLPGDPALVDVARKAGLAVVLEFDYKNEFFAGEDISERWLASWSRSGRIPARCLPSTWPTG